MKVLQLTAEAAQLIAVWLLGGGKEHNSSTQPKRK